MKLVAFLVQLSLVALAILIAYVMAPSINLIPRFLLDVENKALNPTQITDVLVVFLVVHSACYFLSGLINKEQVFSTLQRTLREIHFVTWANCIASSYMFLLSTVPFSANFYLYIYVLIPIAYPPMFLGLTWLAEGRGVGKKTWFQDIRFLQDVKEFLFCWWALVTFVVLITPGLLAIAYKSNRDFADLVNYARVSWNVDDTSSWILLDVFPDKRFEQPMDIKFSSTNDNDFFVLSRTGRLYRISSGPVWAIETLLDISEIVSPPEIENGALSFALHPEFGDTESEKCGFVYVYYTHNLPTIQQNRLSRFDISLSEMSNRVLSEVILIEQDHYPTGMHNGGSVLFDKDGFLYLSIGDFNQGITHSQQIHKTIASGIFKIDVDKRGAPISQPTTVQPADGRTSGYYIPSDNPFVGLDNVLGEFWALGFRNPFRMSLDQSTGDIWLGDVGRDGFEEINRVTKGSNGEWPFKEGPVDNDFGEIPSSHGTTIWGRVTPPYYYYAQTALERAVIGGIVYRGEKYPQLYGKYIFADNQSGIVRSIDLKDRAAEPIFLARATQMAQQGITSIMEAPSGDIFLTLLGGKGKDSGRILKLDISSDPAVDSATNSRTGVSDPTLLTVSNKFDQICSRCHGLDGKGIDIIGFEVLPDFSSNVWQESVTDEHIRTITTKGGAAVGMSSNMPAWEGLFSEQELELLTIKIRSFADPSSTAID